MLKILKNLFKGLKFKIDIKIGSTEPINEDWKRYKEEEIFWFDFFRTYPQYKNREREIRKLFYKLGIK